jgi:hypothetical protein
LRLGTRLAGLRGRLGLRAKDGLGLARGLVLDWRGHRLAPRFRAFEGRRGAVARLGLERAGFGGCLAAWARFVEPAVRLGCPLAGGLSAVCAFGETLLAAAVLAIVGALPAAPVPASATAAAL